MHPDVSERAAPLGSGPFRDNEGKGQCSSQRGGHALVPVISHCQRGSCGSVGADGKASERKCHNYVGKNGPPSFIALSPPCFDPGISGNGGVDAGRWVEFGRKELIRSYKNACGCRYSSDKGGLLKDAGERVEPGRVLSCHPRNRKKRKLACGHCQQVEAWALPFLSRRMVRVRRIASSTPEAVDGLGGLANVSTNDECLREDESSLLKESVHKRCQVLNSWRCCNNQHPKGSDYKTLEPPHEPEQFRFQVQVKGINAPRVVRVNGAHVVVLTDASPRCTAVAAKGSLNFGSPLPHFAQEWRGDAVMVVGSILSFVGDCSKDSEANNNGQVPVNDDSSRKCSRVGGNFLYDKSLHFRLVSRNKCQAARSTETIVGDLNLGKSKSSKSVTPPNDKSGSACAEGNGKLIPGILERVAPAAMEPGREFNCSIRECLPSMEQNKQLTASVDEGVMASHSLADDNYVSEHTAVFTTRAGYEGQKSRAAHEGTVTCIDFSHDAIDTVNTADQSRKRCDKASQELMTRSLRAQLPGFSPDDADDSKESEAVAVAQKVEMCLEGASAPLSQKTTRNPGNFFQGESSDKGIFRREYFILFVPLGKSLPKSRVRILESVVGSKEAVTVVHSLNDVPGPTHVVIDEKVSALALAGALGFKTNIRRMARIFTERNIVTVKTEWVCHPGKVVEPTLDQYWTGLHKIKTKVMKRIPVVARATINGGAINGPFIRVKKVDEFASIKVIKASEVGENNVISRIASKRKRAADTCLGLVPKPNILNDDISRPSRNEKLSDMFDELSKLHKDCPLERMDEWRAYSFAMVASRLRYLDFEVINDRGVLRKVGKVKGFGKSVMSKIAEYFDTGTCARIVEFNRDPARIGIRNMMRIWGVGPAKAAELVRMNYRTIENVRKALSVGRLALSQNALIGVKFYEDFSEKINRNEVHRIGDIVTNAFLEKFPGADIRVMGSYRRGSETSGDVDVLIVHPKYHDSTPKGALSWLVKLLMSRGHITHNLTHVDGNLDSVVSYSSQGEEPPGNICPREAPSVTFQEVKCSQSYMGVFASPVHSGKHRRIDIKFYPYRERAFAWIYFTGNAMFNRAIRLWATKAKCMGLSDHGLRYFDKAADSLTKADRKMFKGARVNIKAETEEDVFNILGLEFKSPSERDGFDAVIAKGTSNPPFECLDD